MCRSENPQALVIGWVERIQEAERSRCIINELVGPLIRYGTSNEVQ